jgi:hypothetical protein
MDSRARKIVLRDDMIELKTSSTPIGSALAVELSHSLPRFQALGSLNNALFQKAPHRGDELLGTTENSLLFCEH